MRIIRPISFDNETRPVQFTRPILDINYKPIEDILISDAGDFYDKETYDQYQYFKDCPKSKKVKVYSTESNRQYVNISSESSNRRGRSPVPRLMLIAFDNDNKVNRFTYYKQFDANHINPSLPLKNTLENLEFISHDENMKKAGETGVMIKKYKKPLVEKICQDICDGVPRNTIMEKYNVNGQLIDDIHAGRSHKSVSEKFLDKGFEYKTFDRTEMDKNATEVCKLLKEGWRNVDIMRKLNVPYLFISDIKHHRTFKHISSSFGL